MKITEDIARITETLQARMERGWLSGDPESITARPLMTRFRHYVVNFRSENGRERWLVDASEPGIVLRSPVGHKESQARAEVLVGRVMRLIKSRLTSNVLRDELTRLQEAAEHEGFDFRTIYAVAARQCAGFHMDLEAVMTEEAALAA